MANNDKKKEAWAQQVADDCAAAKAERLEQQELENAQRVEDKCRAQAEKVEEEKKKPKMAIFDVSRAPPTELRPDISSFARNKLKSFEYVELWYFTLEGKAPISAFKASKHVVLDTDLTWLQMTNGSVNFLWEIEPIWPEVNVKALASFFYGITGHPSEELPHGYAALIVYQACMRRHWHNKLNVPGRSFNPSIFNKTVLTTFRGELIERENAKAVTSVRFSLSFPATSLTMSSPPPFLSVRCTRIISRVPTLPPRAPSRFTSRPAPPRLTPAYNYALDTPTDDQPYRKDPGGPPG
ncbi:hypothetical protein B0H21DRAFT_712162 [Amylocystis lapponica]|nr:hypothetical protein B0H21DRAFT_712162 [Amylocystis lapponica]